MSTANRRYAVEQRWTPGIAKEGWTPIADLFLSRYTRLGVSSSEAMVIIHLVSHKWDEELPFPSARRLSERMGMTETAVRNHIRSLEKKQLLRRQRRDGKANLFDLSPLFQKLELTNGEFEELIRPKKPTKSGLAG